MPISKPVQLAIINVRRRRVVRGPSGLRCGSMRAPGIAMNCCDMMYTVAVWVDTTAAPGERLLCAGCTAS